MGNSAFSKDEIDYLYSLPAVVRVTKSRITYAEAFKRECARRYMMGESPTRVFREAGLDPALIGYKRVERCVARWKMQYGSGISRDMERSADKAQIAPAQTGDVASVASLEEGAVDKAGGKCFVNSEAIMQLFRRKATRWDLRDVLISQQIRRIAELEDRVVALQYREKRLTQMLDKFRNGGEAEPAQVGAGSKKEVSSFPNDNFRWKSVLVPTPAVGNA